MEKNIRDKAKEYLDKKLSTNSSQFSEAEKEVFINMLSEFAQSKQPKQSEVKEVEENDIVFFIKDKEMIRIEENGNFYVKEKLIENDRDLYKGFIDFFKSSNELPLKREPN